MEHKISGNYFSNVRLDIEPLLPPSAKNVLEIGSSNGGTMAWLRERWPDCRFTAVDGFEPMREPLEKIADTVHIVDLNASLPPLDKYDLILALDVFEHLIDPWSLLKNLVGHLDAGGTVIVSVPNISRLDVAVPLLMGKFDYTDDGILDSTHLRFFTKKTALSLLTKAGLSIDRAGYTTLTKPRVKWIDRLTAGTIRDRLTTQFVMRGRIAAAASEPQWQILS